MKKIAFIIFASTFYTNVFAQIEKSSLLVGGNTGLGFSGTKENLFSGQGTSRTASFSPSVGYAVRQNLFLGIGGIFSRTWYPEIDNPKDNFLRVLGGFVFLRKYAPLGKSFFLFAEPSAYYSKAVQRGLWQQNRYVSDEWNAGLALYPGVAYAVKKWLHVELGMNQLLRFNYRNFRSGYAGSNAAPTLEEQNSWNLGVNSRGASSFTVGARILFAK